MKQKISFNFKLVELLCQKVVGNGSNKGLVYPNICALKKKAHSRSVYCANCVLIKILMCVIRAYMLLLVKCYDNNWLSRQGFPLQELLHAANQLEKTKKQIFEFGQQ